MFTVNDSDLTSSLRRVPYGRGTAFLARLRAYGVVERRLLGKGGGWERRAGGGEGKGEAL